MNEPQTNQPRVRIGARNIKSAISATLCAFLYYLIGRNPTFACIGAIFGTGNGMTDSQLNGGNRFFGTIFGGILGMCLFHVYISLFPEHSDLVTTGCRHLTILPFLFIGVVLLILMSILLRWPGAVQPGGVVLCIILFNTPADTYVAYSLNRIIDTGVGVLIALLINYLLPKERLDRWNASWTRWKAKFVQKRSDLQE